MEEVRVEWGNEEVVEECATWSIGTRASGFGSSSNSVRRGSGVTGRQGELHGIKGRRVARALVRSELAESGHSSFATETGFLADSTFC